MENLIEENRKLKERIEYLENIINNGMKADVKEYITTYEQIKSMIFEKAYNAIKDGNTRRALQRKMMSDLKWDLHIRRVLDFRKEHIKQAKEYIENYKIEEVEV